MPSIFRKDGKKKELIKNLGNIYQNIQREHQISPGDFPELKKMQVNKIRFVFLFLLHLIVIMCSLATGEKYLNGDMVYFRTYW